MKRFVLAAVTVFTDSAIAPDGQRKTASDRKTDATAAGSVPKSFFEGLC